MGDPACGCDVPALGPPGANPAKATVARAGAETHHGYRAGHLLYAADGKLE